MIQSRSLLLALSAVATLTAQPVLAQACLGMPFSVGSTAVVGAAGFPDNASIYGLGVSHRANEKVTVGGHYSITSFTGILEALPSMHMVGARAAYELPLQAAASAPTVSICPNGGVDFGKWDDVNLISIPLGVGIGATFPVSDDLALIAPYANPQFHWVRASYEGESDSDTDFGFTIGVNLVVGNIFVGPSFSKVGDADGVFGINLGFVF